MQQLSIQDAGFIYQETEKTPMHVSCMCIFDQSTANKKRMSKKQILEYIDARLHQAPIMKKKLMHSTYELERPYWIDAVDFDLKNHIFQLALPKPGNYDQLTELVSGLITTPLDMTKPLWELYIIEGLNDYDGIGKNSFALFTKIHHSCVDGSSGNNLFAAIVDLEADATGPMSQADDVEQNTSPATPLPGKYEMLTTAYARNLGSAIQQTVSFNKRLPSLAKTAAQLYRQERHSGAKLEVPLTRFNRTPDKERVFAYTNFDLESIKAIKNATGTTLNDVMVCIIAGAMRRFLDDKGELPDTPLGALLPKNIRSDDEKQAKSGNRVGGLFASIHTDISDAKERLSAIHESTKQAKEFAEQENTDAIFPNLMGGFLYPKVGKAFTRMAQKHRVMERLGPKILNTVITNVAGPTFDLYHAGAQLKYFYAAPPLTDGAGISHAVYSFQDMISISVVSCPSMLDDTDFYMQCCQDTYQELLAAVG